jgi:hypothetical protein
MYSQSSKHKPKQKMNPINMDFGFMIKNHPEFFTKLFSRDHIPERPLLRRGAFLTFLLGGLTCVSQILHEEEASG